MRIPLRTVLSALAATCALAAHTDRAVAGGALSQLVWRYQTGDAFLSQFITVTPDGTIYTSAGDGLHAVDPAGRRIWLVPGLGGGRPIARAADGTLFVGHVLGPTSGAISAVSAAGLVLWSFLPPTAHYQLKAGPTLGPGGHIYAVQDTDSDGENGLGMFSLDADGNLRWSNVGEPPLTSLQPDANSNVQFSRGGDRLFVGVPQYVQLPTTRAFDPVTGEQIWYEGDLGFNMHTYPVLDPKDRILGSFGQTGIQALDEDGQRQWLAFHPGNPSVVLRPEVGADGVIYTGDWSQIELWALDPDGSTRWVQPPVPAHVQMLTLSPDEQTLIVGGRDGFGEPSWIRGYSAEDGAFLWQIDIPGENGADSLVYCFDAAFSPDGATLYVNIQFAGDVNDFGYLIAIRFQQAGAPAADLGG